MRVEVWEHIGGIVGEYPKTVVLAGVMLLLGLLFALIWSIQEMSESTFITTTMMHILIALLIMILYIKGEASYSEKLESEQVLTELKNELGIENGEITLKGEGIFVINNGEDRYIVTVNDGEIEYGKMDNVKGEDI